MTKIIYQLAIGQKPEKQLDYKTDQYNRFLFGDIMWLNRTKANRFNAKSSFFSFFRKATYYQLIRKNDFGPILGYVMENAEMLWNKDMRNFRLG